MPLKHLWIVGLPFSMWNFKLDGSSILAMKTPSEIDSYSTLFSVSYHNWTQGKINRKASGMFNPQ